SDVVMYQTTCGLEAAGSSGDVFIVTSNHYLTNADSNISQDLANCNPQINADDPTSFRSQAVNGATWIECVTRNNGGAWATWAFGINPSNGSEEATVEVIPFVSKDTKTGAEASSVWLELEGVVDSVKFN
ncbi:MAG: hypothetical protein ACRDFB_00235, partial [Rhabdochlamydiaceae bacterium]